MDVHVDVRRIQGEDVTMKTQPEIDQIGYWSEVKLEILKEYASAYSRILAAQQNPSLYHVYIDAFAGAGVHKNKLTQSFVPGSPVNALLVQPPFREYHLIDIATEKIESLRSLLGSRQDVSIYQGDCNRVLLDEVFPRVRFEDYKRGLCVLDPYGLHLDWKVIATAGKMKTLDIFLNFPVADINRNVLWRDRDAATVVQKTRLDAFWGDNSWSGVAYRTDMDLFGNPEKQPNEVIAEAFRDRLVKVAGFNRVPKPLPMRNTKGAIVYYLYFASQKDTGENIVLDIFRKYEGRGGG